jgi:hypothetical protein
MNMELVGHLLLEILVEVGNFLNKFNKIMMFLDITVVTQNNRLIN